MLFRSGFATLYFSAWENDFSDDALVSLIGEISASLKELSAHGDESKAQESFEKAKAFGVGLVKRSIPVVVKLATAGVLDLDNLSEQAIASLTESMAREQIEKYEKYIKGIREIQDLFDSFNKKAGIDDRQI